MKQYHFPLFNWVYTQNNSIYIQLKLTLCEVQPQQYKYKYKYCTAQICKSIPAIVAPLPSVIFFLNLWTNLVWFMLLIS
jgi:hypothetical protein